MLGKLTCIEWRETLKVSCTLLLKATWKRFLLLIIPNFNVKNHDIFQEVLVKLGKLNTSPEKWNILLRRKVLKETDEYLKGGANKYQGINNEIRWRWYLIQGILKMQ